MDAGPGKPLLWKPFFPWACSNPQHPGLMCHLREGHTSSPTPQCGAPKVGHGLLVWPASSRPLGEATGTGQASPGPGSGQDHNWACSSGQAPPHMPILSGSLGSSRTWSQQPPNKPRTINGVYAASSDISEVQNSLLKPKAGFCCCSFVEQK